MVKSSNKVTMTFTNSLDNRSEQMMLKPQVTKRFVYLFNKILLT